MSITFTQFLRPDGEQVEIKIRRPINIERLASVCRRRGVRFTAEYLDPEDRQSLVSLIAEYLGKDIAAELISNGPDIPLAVDRLVKKAAVLVGVRV